MQSVIGALRVNLGLDSAQFRDGLNDARTSLAKAGTDMRRIGQTLSLAVTAPLAGFAAVTVQTAGEFEASMNRVKAALGASDAEFDALSAKARELGESTQFSASEAAEGIEILAKNGVNAADILGGALDSSLTLAAASSANLGEAADVATDVMLNFGKQAGELQGVVDNVTGVLLQSKFGFDDYRLAIGQAGGVAGGFGVELEEFNAVIAATSSSFASGSDAGTSFKTFLQSLSNDSKPAQAALETLGAEFFDAEGNMKSMAEVAEELKQGVAGLSEETRNVALKDIFGTDALRTAIALSREGAEGIRGMTAAISEASASEQAAARMEGLNGQLRSLKSAFQELQLTIADSGLLAIVTSIVAGITELARAIGDADPQLVQFGAVAAALAAAIGPLAVAIGLVVTALSAPAVGLIAVFVAVVAGAVAFKEEIVAVKDQIVSAFGSLPDQMQEIGEQVIAGLTSGIYGKLVDLNTAIDDTVNGMVKRIRSGLGIKSPSRVFREIGDFVMQGLGQGIQEGAAGVDSAMDGIADGLGTQFGSLFKGVLFEGQSFVDGLSGILSGIGGKLIDTGLGGFGSLLSIPGFASGTNYAPGGLAWVGERGPELVDLPKGSRVIPNENLPSGQQSVHVTVGVSTDGNGNLMPFVRDVAQKATNAGLSRFDRALPGKVNAARANTHPRTR